MHIILDAAVEVGRPTLFSMLIIIAAHIPIFTLQRHEGRIFAPMAYSVTSALVGLADPLADAGAAAVRGDAAQEPAGEGELSSCGRCKRCVRARAGAGPSAASKIVLGIAVAALAGSLALVPSLGTEFLPELNEGSIWVNLTLPTSVSVTEAQTDGADGAPGDPQGSRRSRTVISKAGRPEDGTDPKLINMAEFLVDLKPESEWKRGIDKATLLREMEAAIDKTAGHRADLFAADPRQRARNHLADRRADRDQGVRRRSRRCCATRRSRSSSRCRTCRASRAPSSTGWASCRRSRSRSTARARRATASTSPTSRT